MPLAWIHDLPRQQLEGLASQLGLSTDGTLDDLRKRVKEKWTAVEPYLPSQSAAKSFLLTTPVQQNMDPSMHQGNCLSKIKIKLVTDLISGILVLSGTDPEEISFGPRSRWVVNQSTILQFKLPYPWVVLDDLLIDVSTQDDLFLVFCD
jgi:hypothetical protein